MKKKNLLFIIIFSTFVSIGTMIYYSGVACKTKYYEVDKITKKAVIRDEKDYITKDNINNDSQGKLVKKADEETSNTKDDLEKKDLVKDELSHDQKSKDNLNANSTSEDDIKNNLNKDITGDIYSLRPEIDDYNSEQQAQSVFKVSTGKIVESLTTSDKIKLLYISFKIGKEDYKKVEEYLNAVDAAEGVLKALKLLKQDLSKNEYEKVRKIAGKFIDMDAAEMLK